MIFVSFISRVLFASVFLVAAFGKLRAPTAFQVTIRRIGVNSRLAFAIAWVLITYEVVLGVMFFLGIFPVLSVVAAFMLLLTFIVVSVRAIRQETKIPCNCFGQSETSLGYQTFMQAIALTILVVIYFFSTLFADSTWWPTTIATAIPSLSLVIAILLLTRWFFAMKSVLTLASDLRKSNEDAALHRVQSTIQNVQQKEAIS